MATTLDRQGENPLADVGWDRFYSGLQGTPSVLVGARAAYGSGLSRDELTGVLWVACAQAAERGPAPELTWTVARRWGYRAGLELLRERGQWSAADLGRLRRAKVVGEHSERVGETLGVDAFAQPGDPDGWATVERIARQRATGAEPEPEPEPDATPMADWIGLADALRDAETADFGLRQALDRVTADVGPRSAIRRDLELYVRFTLDQVPQRDLAAAYGLTLRTVERLVGETHDALGAALLELPQAATFLCPEGRDLASAIRALRMATRADAEDPPSRRDRGRLRRELRAQRMRLIGHALRREGCAACSGGVRRALLTRQLAVDPVTLVVAGSLTAGVALPAAHRLGHGLGAAAGRVGEWFTQGAAATSSGADAMVASPATRIVGAGLAVLAIGQGATAVIDDDDRRPAAVTPAAAIGAPTATVAPPSPSPSAPQSTPTIASTPPRSIVAPDVPVADRKSPDPTSRGFGSRSGPATPARRAKRTSDRATIPKQRRAARSRPSNQSTVVINQPTPAPAPRDGGTSAVAPTGASVVIAPRAESPPPSAPPPTTARTASTTTAPRTSTPPATSSDDGGVSAFGGTP